MATEKVLTPGGFRHHSLVHKVGDGETLRAEDDFVKKVDPHGNTLLDTADFSAAAAQDVSPMGSSWISYAYWVNETGAPITSFSTTWTVPEAPRTQEGQVIYLFNGLINPGSNNGILQPVLQWGVSAAGGGPYWAITSWYVTTSGPAFHSHLTQVNPGDVLTGVMTQSDEGEGMFKATSGFKGFPESEISVDNVAELLWYYQTLEAYSLTQCSDYPASSMTAFTAIELQGDGIPSELNWTIEEPVKDCGQHIIVVDDSSTNGEIDIYYR